MRASVTNSQVASEIGLTHSTVSRIRSGERTPSIDTMLKIEMVYDWSAASQMHAAVDGAYGKTFEIVLAKKYGAAVDAPAPA